MAISDSIANIHFHDSTLLGVQENTADQSIIFFLDYPVDWDANKFQKKKLIFTDVTSYALEEIPFVGPPDILDCQILRENGETATIKLTTNAGWRQLTFKSLVLSD